MHPKQIGGGDWPIQCRGILFYSHGFGGHSQRRHAMANYFCKEGYVFVSVDHQGIHSLLTPQPRLFVYLIFDQPRFWKERRRQRSCGEIWRLRGWLWAVRRHNSAEGLSTVVPLAALYLWVSSSSSLLRVSPFHLKLFLMTLCRDRQSMGGTIAIEVANRNPHRWSGVILSAPAIVCKPTWVWNLQDALTSSSSSIHRWYMNNWQTPSRSTSWGNVWPFSFFCSYSLTIHMYAPFMSSTSRYKDCWPHMCPNSFHSLLTHGQETKTRILVQ